MNKDKIKECTQYLRENCEEFIARVWIYMVDNNWRWTRKNCNNRVPNQKIIKECFFELLDELDTKEETIGIGTGGFNIRINENSECVECYFGSECDSGKGITLKSKELSNDTKDFINFLCEECPILDKEQVMKKYNDWKQYGKKKGTLSGK